MAKKREQPQQPSSSVRDRVGELVRIPASQIAGAPWNWRTHPGDQEAAVVASLEELGIYAPLLGRRLANGTIELIDGHLRRAIFSKLGPGTMIPVILCDLDEAEAKKANLLHDPLAGMAVASAPLLESLLNEVKTDSPELQALFKQMAEDAGLNKQTAGSIDQDEVPEVPEEAITNPGDVWILGRHRLMCGDASDPDAVQKLMDGNLADMLLTDPPYGVAYVGKTKDALKVENDDLDEGALRELMGKVFNVVRANCREGAYWYATVPPGPLHLVFAQDWKERGILRQVLVWSKDSMVLGRSEYHYQHEPILFGWVPGERHKNPDRTRTSVWECPRPKASREHPTMKPVALWARAMIDGSRSGEIVFDPFMGSGTTIVAAEQLGRRAFGMEVSPLYCDVIVKRWEILTGQQAVR
jgi:DNA modification methylase